ncbi:MAG: molybdopterin adenylyltransferase [Bacteroidia bacterium]|jgi:MOSC domain-containing protein YiiM
MGRILAVCIGPGGIPKRTVSVARVTESGIEGDAQRLEVHGGADRAVCLLSEKEVKDLCADGVPHGEPGQFGENLRVDGLDFSSLRPGDQLAIGRVSRAGVSAGRILLEITDMRSPCVALSSIDERLPDLMLGRSGLLCKVLESGEVAPGMAIELAE